MPACAQRPSQALTLRAGTQSRGEHCDPYNASCCKPGLICDTRHEHGSYKCLKRISKGCHEDQSVLSLLVRADSRSDCGHEQVCIHSNGATYCGKYCALGRCLAWLTIRRAKLLRRLSVEPAKSVACIGPVLVDRARLRATQAQTQVRTKPTRRDRDETARPKRLVCRLDD